MSKKKSAAQINQAFVDANERRKPGQTVKCQGATISGDKALPTISHGGKQYNRFSKLSKELANK